MGYELLIISNFLYVIMTENNSEYQIHFYQISRKKVLDWKHWTEHY